MWSRDHQLQNLLSCLLKILILEFNSDLYNLLGWVLGICNRSTVVGGGDGKAPRFLPFLYSQKKLGDSLRAHCVLGVGFSWEEHSALSTRLLSVSEDASPTWHMQ